MKNGGLLFSKGEYYEQEGDKLIHWISLIQLSFCIFFAGNKILFSLVEMGFSYIYIAVVSVMVLRKHLGVCQSLEAVNFDVFVLN